MLASVIRGRPVVLGVAGIEDPAARSAPRGRRAPVAHRRRRSLARLALPRRAQERGRDRCGGRRPRPRERRPRGRRGPAHPRRRRGRGPAHAHACASRCSAWPRGCPAWRCAPARTASRRWSSATSPIPTQPDGGVWIHYARPAPARFVSAAAVLSGAADARQFEGSSCSSASTALAIGDYQATPVADRMPDVEIHAQLVEGIFAGDLLSRPWWTVWLEAAVLAAGGRDPDPRACPRCPRPPRPRLPRSSPRRRWRSRSASTSAAGSCSTRRCRSSAWARCSRRCSARRWRRPRASAAPSAARWRGSARSPRASRASSRRRAASRWAACRPRPPPSPARRASTSTRFSLRRARWAAISTTSSGSTPIGSSSSSATCRARGCRAACSWR